MSAPDLAAIRASAAQAHDALADALANFDTAQLVADELRVAPFLAIQLANLSAASLALTEALVRAQDALGAARRAEEAALQPAPPAALNVVTGPWGRG